MSKRMYRLDFVRHVIYVKANYLKRAENPKTQAYVILNQLLRDNPTFTIKSEGVVKNHYNHLSYNVMANFFKANGLLDALEQLEAMRNDKTLDNNKEGRNIRKYNAGVIRAWFINNYGYAAKAQGYLDNDNPAETAAESESIPADDSSGRSVTFTESNRHTANANVA